MLRWRNRSPPKVISLQRARPRPTTTTTAPTPTTKTSQYASPATTHVCSSQARLFDQDQRI